MEGKGGVGMTDELKNISLTGRLCYLFMCIEKFLVSCYPDRDWTPAAKKCWQWRVSGCQRLLGHRVLVHKIWNNVTTASDTPLYAEVYLLPFLSDSDSDISQINFH